jgi:soluble lytic murein transglycosylase
MTQHAQQQSPPSSLRHGLKGWLGLLLATAASMAHGFELAQARRDFLQAERALAAGQMESVGPLLERLEGYPLAPHLQARWLRARWGSAEPAETSRWLATHAGDWPAEALRTEWLRHLARSGDGVRLVADWAPQEDAALECHHLRALARRSEPDGPWFSRAASLWAVGSSRPPDCDPVFERLLASPTFDDSLHWRRLNDAIRRGNTGFAEWLVRRFPDRNAPHAQGLLAAMAQPERWLEARRDAPPADDPRASNVETLAYTAWARKSAVAAAEHLAARLGTGPIPDHARPQALVVTDALLDGDHPDAGAWLDRLPPATLPARTQAALIGWALKRQHWQGLVRWTAVAAAEGMERLRWSYFRARALEATGEDAAARAIYRDMANGTDYYALRAAERLGQPYRFDGRRGPAPDAQSRTRMEGLPAVARAREWLALGRPLEARREWREFTRPLDEPSLALAAHIAHSWGWHDRALITAARVRELDDPELRFPLAWRDEIERAATREGLPPFLVFSIVRNESAFQPDAGSGAGAQGLMQLMPATGRETAARLGLRLDSSRDLLDPRINLRLGSHYLSRMLERYEGNLAMAAAAYNAGPGRVAKWRPGSGCRNAETWIESIPFRETHAYVRRVLAYNVVYAWRLGMPAPRLDDIAPPVPARATPLLACLEVAGLDGSLRDRGADEMSIPEPALAGERP